MQNFRVYNKPFGAKLRALNRCKQGLITTTRNLLLKVTPPTSTAGSPAACTDPSPACKGRAFLATDLTLLRDNSHTMMTTIDEQLHAAGIDAIREVVNTLCPARGEHLRAVVSVVDEGQEAIVEKLVVMKSGVFVAAPEECGGMDSSFTCEIREWRQQHSLTVVTWQMEEE